MSSIPNEIISKFPEIQEQVWQSVSAAATEAFKSDISFETPLTTTARPTELTSELSAPMMVLQFGLSSFPEHTQALLFTQETVLELISTLRKEEVKEIDDTVVEDLRPTCEAIINGLCLGVGQVLGDALAATNVSVQFQLFQFPVNLQTEEVLRTQIALMADNLHGTATWLVDVETAHHMLGMEYFAPEDQIFAQAAAPAGATKTRSANDEGSLDILMDIPLEISVELGRTRMLVKEVIELGTGSVVEIDKAAGEPVDVIVNGRLVARGEVVVIEDNFGVRITEILNPTERLNKLGEAA
jgi:flagellar motor switch protein FliN/FliY